jgi:alpha-mannosidase
VDYLSMSRFSKGLYSWFSPDGSSILAFSPGHYADFKARVEGTGFEQAAGYIASSAADWLTATAAVSYDIPLISMSDMSGPDRYDSLLARWSTIGKIVDEDGSPLLLSLPPIRQSTLQTYLDRVAPALPSLPVIRGERPNIWLYIHGPTHHHAISAKREADVLLPAAEIFNTVNALLEGSFASYPRAELTEAWEAQIYPDHGWGGKNGDITDSTFQAKYEFARDVSGGLLRRSLESIASRVTLAADAGIPIVVFNSLSWSRTAPVRVTVLPPAGFAGAGLDVHDANGRIVPVQCDVTRRHADGSVAAADLLFVAEHTPPVGYRTFYARRSTPAAQTPTASDAVTTLENRHYRLDLGPGGVKQIIDRELDKPLLDGGKFLGGELFTMQSVGEDAGEWSEPQLPTMEGFDRLANHSATWKRVESGPVRDVAEARYTLANASVVQRVILYAGIKRVDFEVSLLGWDGTKYREFRLAFPLRVDQGQVAYEVPFGTLELGKGEMKGAAGERYTQEVSQVRPRAIQNWIGLYGPRLGVTLSSSVAVWDHIDPTEPDAQRRLLQPVLLASRRSCHGEGPWYLQQGDHHFRFSLTSHAPGWESGQRQGVAANAPLFAVAAPGRAVGATLSPSGSFLSLGAENLVLSTMKKSESDDAVIVRLFDSAGKPATASFSFFTPITKAEETNLLEDAEKLLPSERTRVTVDVGPYEIRTVKITPELR